MKKIAIALAVISLSVILVIAGSYAWFSDTDELENEFVVGHQDVRLVEVFDGDYGDHAKKVSVANVGDVAVLVRVSVVPILMVDGERINTDGIIELEFADNYTDSWQLGERGWYYYKFPLLPGEQTIPNLLEGVKFNEENIDWEIFGGAVLDVDVMLGSAPITKDYLHEGMWDLGESGINGPITKLLREICDGYTP